VKQPNAGLNMNAASGLGRCRKLSRASAGIPASRPADNRAGQPEGAVVLAANGRGEQADAEEKEQKIHRHQHHAHDFALCDRAQHNGNGQRRRHGQHPQIVLTEVEASFPNTTS
jgi:hypothetical protein